MNYSVTTPTERNGRKDAPKKRRPAFDLTQLQQFYWVFELEDDGTVIYSRPHSFGTGDEMEGHNFFDESLGFEDISRCRRHFHSFIKSNKAAAGFTWRCSSEGKSMDTKVLMTRAYQTGSHAPRGVVMMEIRGS